jgi:hypothetical protein
MWLEQNNLFCNYVVICRAYRHDYIQIKRMADQKRKTFLRTKIFLAGFGIEIRTVL